MVSEKSLEVNHHAIVDIPMMIVVLHILGEDIIGVDDASYVLHLDIFLLVVLPNHFPPEVEVLDTFLCN